MLNPKVLPRRIPPNAISSIRYNSANRYVRIREVPNYQQAEVAGKISA